MRRLSSTEDGMEVASAGPGGVSVLSGSIRDKGTTAADLSYYGHSPNSLSNQTSWHSELDHGELNNHMSLHTSTIRLMNPNSYTQWEQVYITSAIWLPYVVVYSLQCSNKYCRWNGLSEAWIIDNHNGLNDSCFALAEIDCYLFRYCWHSWSVAKERQPFIYPFEREKKKQSNLAWIACLDQVMEYFLLKTYKVVQIHNCLKQCY